MVENETTSMMDAFLDPEGEEPREEEPRRTGGTSARQWLVLLAGVVLFAVVVVAAVLVLRASADEPAEGTPVAWRDPVVSGTSVTVSWDASPCAEEGTATVEETTDTVVVTVREVPRQALCSSPGDVRESTLQLDSPVGERQLVDGSLDADAEG
ncbi:hypothetical protein RDV89_15965 [Nocardioides zeae]|uniref:Uncharacterized protein n=1 Tax=Nocardioides imazamoxiresistens TaxID=3231893 RepID=A0ABU3PZA8_9ACTN|nr:hypothetical protein [Nocardioides zeae]MDT9594581.1 hypothetical protein [Nocardioides zeae]